MKTVILMRHAEAEAESADGRDFDRVLTCAGRKMAHDSALLLEQAGIVIDRILASAAVRTQQTAEALASLNPSAVCIWDRQLYHASGDDYAAAIRREAEPAERSIALVGHNPSMTQLMRAWSERALSVTPATLLVLEQEIDDWNDLGRSSQAPLRIRLLIQEGKSCPCGP